MVRRAVEEKPDAVPWCETCNRFYNDRSLAPDGTCTSCGRFIADQGGEGDDEGGTKVPWHFWLMVAALVIYLGWRLVQLVEWLFF